MCDNPRTEFVWFRIEVLDSLVLDNEKSYSIILGKFIEELRNY
jgi:hypothetical protein